MNVFYVLGSIGGIIVLLEEFCVFIRVFKRFVKKYKRYEKFYKSHGEDDEIKIPIGFKTQKEQAEFEARLKTKDAS